MNLSIEHNKLLILAFRFVLFEIKAKAFVRQFHKLWENVRDSQWSMRETWGKPYDKILLTDLAQKRISAEEFDRQWNKLWGYPSEDGVRYHELIDRIESACEMYREKPETEYEYDEQGLRAYVTEELSSYLRTLAKANGAFAG